MTDYTELIRQLKTYEDGYGLYDDAAAAIEALQDEVKRLEPKRGEWSREMDVNDEPFYQCSVCGECFDFNSDSTHEVFNYCPNCGAKMEVQE